MKYRRFLREENIFDGGESCSTTKNMTIQRSYLLGVFVKDGQGGWKISKRVDSIEEAKKSFDTRMEIMKNHLGETLTKFESKMNNLDSNIQLRHTELEPFTYTCEVYAAYYIPPMTNRLAYGMTEEEFPSLKAWLRSTYGNDDFQSPKYFPINDRRVPGVVPKYFKVGEFETTGYTTSVSFELSGYQLGGLKFVGTVAPYINSTEEGGQYADVKLVDEFNNNVQLKEYLKETSSSLKCDSCGRHTSRDLYFIFIDEAEKLHYYGRNCAAKVFGISIIDKLGNFMRGLDHIGEEFASKNDDFTMKEDQIKNMIGVMMLSNTLTAQKFDYNSLYSQMRNDSLHDNSLAKFMEANKGEIERKYEDFMANGHSFFESIDKYASDFEQKIKAFGLAFTNGTLTSLRKIQSWVLPYALNKYFRFAVLQSRNKVADSNGNITPFGFFGGYKKFYGTVIAVNPVKTYHIIMAKASEEPGGEEKFGIMWYEFNGATVSVGDKVSVYGSYSKYNKNGSKFTTIDRPKIEKIDQTNPMQGATQNAVTYNNGQRLRNCPVTVKKTFNNAIIVTTEDGFDFAIYTLEFGTNRSKYNINFFEGQKLVVTGTVQTSPTGRIYLNRCIVNVNEGLLRKNLIRLTESDLHRVVKETVNRVLKEGWRKYNLYKDGIHYIK